MITRHAKLKEFGIRWPYWFCVVGFFLAGLGGFLGIKYEPESKLDLLTAGFFFMLLAFLAVLWPIRRTGEAQGARFISRPTKRLPYQGLLVPVSKAKVMIALIGGALLIGGGAWIVLTSGHNEYKVKGGLAIVGYLVILAQFVYRSNIREPGILLSEKGIAWHDFLSAPCFISWDEIALAMVYFHKERHGKSLSFGVAVRHIDSLDASSGTRKKLEDHFKRDGFHFRYTAESLLEPLGVVARAVNFYRQHPKARNELATSAALHRIQEFERTEEPAARD